MYFRKVVDAVYRRCTIKGPAALKGERRRKIKRKIETEDELFSKPSFPAARGHVKKNKPTELRCIVLRR